ncbi:hypothetical protein PU345_004315 [Enterobacter kobei]|nr:hypothetical protein [Enterobacter kobei]
MSLRKDLRGDVIYALARTWPEAVNVMKKVQSEERDCPVVLYLSDELLMSAVFNVLLPNPLTIWSITQLYQAPEECDIIATTPRFHYLNFSFRDREILWLLKLELNGISGSRLSGVTQKTFYSRKYSLTRKLRLRNDNTLILLFPVIFNHIDK